MDGGGNKLNFGGFSGYYDYMSYHQGYGGFDWYADFFYMNDSTWNNPNGVGYQEGWCDTGYQNEAAMSGATSLGWIYQFGLMESAKGHSFTFVSMNAAASFSKNAVWDLISYTENNGTLYQKAVDELKVSFTGKHVKLAALGNPDDFTNIAAVGFQLVSYGKGGNTCTYGYPTVGAQLAIGNLRFTWSKNADLNNNNGRLATPFLMQHLSHGAPHPTAERQQGHTGYNDSHHATAGPHQWQNNTVGQYEHVHQQFHLPMTDHFF